MIDFSKAPGRSANPQKYLLPSFSPDQSKAFDAITAARDGEHRVFFLTGGAGTGKSFMIQQIYKECVLKGLSVALTATTGMAAQLIQGRTLHSFCAILPRKGAIESTNADRRMRNTDMLIVDEVSMMNGELLDSVLARCRMAGHRPNILFVGDFLQLPPVEGTFAFEHDWWKTNVEVLKLTTSHRQDQHSAFFKALSDLRFAHYSTDLDELIKSRTVSSLPDDCVQLHSHNVNVDAINESKLKQIQQPEYSYMASYWSPEDIVRDSLIKRFRLQHLLSVRLGARVVFLLNDADGRWVNGSTATVTACSEKGIRVKLDRCGYQYDVYPVTEENTDSNGMIDGRISQYPLRLAWALTVHKAQGMTMDRVGVNLDNHFVAGQTYVAMSRARTAEGLFLTGTYKYFPLHEAVEKAIYGA